MRNSHANSVRALKAATLAAASTLALTGTGAAAQSQGANEEASSTDQNVIIVTARKREETLLEVPLAISVFSQEEIADRGIQTAAQLSNYTPGFVFQEVGQGGSSGRENPNIRFRGVAVQNENPAARAGAVFYEGAYLSAGAGLLPLFDIGRVEVIKGPQNAFFGRNTFAGAVNFFPTEPGDEIEGFAQALYSPSDQDTYQVSGAVSLPLAESLGARVGAYYRREGADFTYGNGDPLGEDKTLALQGTLLFDSGPIRLKTTAYWVDAEDTRGLVSLDYTTAPGDCDLVYSGRLRDIATGDEIGDFSTDLSLSNRGTFCGNIPDYDKNGFNVSPVGSFEGNTVPLSPFSAQIPFYQTLPPEAQGLPIPSAPNGLGNNYYTWRVNQSGDFELGDHTISAILSYGRAGNYRINDTNYGQSDPASPNILVGALASYAADLVGEIRIASPDDKRLRYVFGYSHIDSKVRLIEFPLFAGFGGASDDNPLTFSDLTSDALFGSVDFDITDQLTLSVEGRYAWDTLTTVYNGPTLRDYDRNNLPASVRFVADKDQKLNKFMPRVLLSYNPNDSLNIYGSFALSYLLGQDTNITEYALLFPNAADLGLTVENIGLFTDPQKLTAYEIGVKAQPTSNLSVSVAAYMMDWKNQITFNLGPQFRPLYTAGDSEYKGIEAEATFKPVPWLNLNGYISYVDAQFTDFGGTGSVVTQILFPGISGSTNISSDGLVPRYISKWTSAFGARVALDQLFNLDREVFFRIDGNYTGDFYEDNLEYNKINGFWKFNARLGAKVTDSLRIDLYGLNLTDDLSFTSSGGTTTGSLGSAVPFATRKTFGTLPRAREIGVELRLDF
ncbi:TonB-dependent receptor [Altererythrobacter sp. BO-6]|uniref:TonB-dependent receptor n=1 Tax=Altererythrobacter sp. BO-6 TaxID=2604537 RepID=UPI0013E1735C|nr:TonB-dependent receptor [Altererythrobacter sp. BO-6]QIG53616.1 TonB-dependent receptor [Altererythrobacter sp. BO-6]